MVSDINKMSRQDLLNCVNNRKNEIAEKLKSGETEEEFMIGSSSYTNKEWDNLINKVDKNIEEKDTLINELNKLDEGFESLYAHIKEQLLAGRHKYKAQIAVLQKKIAEVTEKSVAIQAQEARNKKLAESYFAKAKQELKKGRRSSKAALDYYKSMNKTQMVSPQFMDKKK